MKDHSILSCNEWMIASEMVRNSLQTSAKESEKTIFLYYLHPSLVMYRHLFIGTQYIWIKPHVNNHAIEVFSMQYYLNNIIVPHNISLNVLWKEFLEKKTTFLNPLSAKNWLSPKWKWPFASARLAFRLRRPLSLCSLKHLWFRF